MNFDIERSVFSAELFSQLFSKPSVYSGGPFPGSSFDSPQGSIGAAIND